MFKSLLALLLVGLLFHGLNAAPALAAQAKTGVQADEKVKLKVSKMGVGEKARVTVRTRTGRKIKGFISQSGADGFTVRDRNSGEATILSYNEVAKVEDNRGHSTLRNVLIGVGIGAGAFLAVIAIIFASIDD